MFLQKLRLANENLQLEWHFADSFVCSANQKEAPSPKFRLSGNVDKSFYRLLKLQITYMVFVTFLFVLDSLIKWYFQYAGPAATESFYHTFGDKFFPLQNPQPFNFYMLGNWFVHQYDACESFPVVMGSFWYLKVYYIVTIFSVIILRFFSKHIPWFIALCAILILIYNFAMPSYPSGQVGYVTFYLMIFLIAHQMKGKKIPAKVIPILYVIFAIAVFGVLSYYGQDITYKLNKNKFPPKIPYIVAASLSIVTVLVFYNRLKITKDSIVTYIGKNAIFYYFAQGISSSLVYFLVAALVEDMHWAVLVVIVYVCNVLLAIGIAELLKKIDALGWKTLEFLRQKTAV